MPTQPPRVRARILAIVNASPGWMTARAIASDAGLDYKQVIDALNMLRLTGRVARLGRTATARWGSLVLVEHDPSTEAIATLESVFRTFRAPPDASDGVE